MVVQPHRTLSEEPPSQRPGICDLFRSSSGEVFLWKSAKVPAQQRLVHSADEGVDHLLHVGGEGVEGRLLGP